MAGATGSLAGLVVVAVSIESRTCSTGTPLAKSSTGTDTLVRSSVPGGCAGRHQHVLDWSTVRDAPATNNPLTPRGSIRGFRVWLPRLISAPGEAQRARAASRP
jgi:hypothetical protein